MKPVVLLVLARTTEPSGMGGFLVDRGLWVAIVAGVVVLIVGRLLFERHKRRAGAEVKQAAGDNAQQTAITARDGQTVTLDHSQRVQDATGPVIHAETGAIVNVNIVNQANPYDYTDGVLDSPRKAVVDNAKDGRAAAAAGDHAEAERLFQRALEQETDPEKRGALLIQIGNTRHARRQYIKAGESYAAALREAEKANDDEGIASALGSIANTYMDRPASSGAARGENVRKAVEHYLMALETFTETRYPTQRAMTQNNLGTAYTDLPAETAAERAANVRKAIDCYNAALEIRKKNEYPVEYAGTQNNLGSAYTDLPAETAAERAENVRKAVACYEAALEIRKKGEYPQDFCQTAANLGMALLSIDDKDGCRWLREAYALRQFLPDQGERLQKLLDEECGEENGPA